MLETIREFAVEMLEESGEAEERPHSSHIGAQAHTLQGQVRSLGRGRCRPRHRPGEGLSSPQRSDVFVDLKLLSDHRNQLVRARTRLINRTHTDLVISHPGYEKKMPKLNSKKNRTAR